MDKDEFSNVEDYLRRNQYPEGISKGDKANARRKCKYTSSSTVECSINQAFQDTFDMHM